MTRLTDNHLGNQQSLPQHQPELTHQPTPQLTQAQQLLEQTLPTTRPGLDTATNDRLLHDRPNAADAPTAVAVGLPVPGEEPAVTGSDASSSGHRLGEAWATVFGHGDDGQATNMLMKKVAVLQATKNNLDRDAEKSTDSAHVVRRTLPEGSLSLNGDGSVRTPGGFTVLNDGGYSWRIREPSGNEHRIWGDPHVDENNDGQTDWHFNRDASFILPDGTKIFCDTTKVGSYGGADVTLSEQLKIQYLDSLASMDVHNGGGASLSEGGLAYDNANKDGQLFVLAEDHRFLDGNSLGDLYDRGGDFIADVNRDQTGTISDLARIALNDAHQVSRHTAIMQDRARSEKAVQNLPTLAQMVTNVFDNARQSKRGDTEEKSAAETLRPLRQITGINR